MADLHMLQLHLDQQRLFRWANRERRSDWDTGYLVHGVLGALFGSQTPKPFVIQKPQGRLLRVLAYDHRDATILMKQAHAFALPEALAILDGETIHSKRMPLPIDVGRRVGFTVNVCPVSRKAEQGPLYGKGRELDAFLLAWEKAGEGETNRPNRNEVYLQWFRQALDRHGGTSLDRVRLVGHRRIPIFRKGGETVAGQGKKERPEAVFSGILQVTDAEKFTALLQRGIGRHRAFGFGMVLLRPTD